GAYIGRLNGTVEVGDPGLPNVTGKELVSELKWRLNTQDSPVVPSRGTPAYSILQHVFDGPDITPPPPGDRSSVDLTQLQGEMDHFWSVRKRDRVFVLGGGGTSFKGNPLITNQYTLGSPLHLGAYENGELRGDEYYILTGGYLRQFGRLPDFLGGPIFGGGWLENGDAFNDWTEAKVRTNISGGVIMDTLVGPVILGASAGFD